MANFNVDEDLQPQIEFDCNDEWSSDEMNGCHSINCSCLECDADNLTDGHNTFLEIENNYFMGWADRKISPNQSLLKFFKCIELCDNYNTKYSSDPTLKDTNCDLKLLKYHYNSLKYCVETQYTLKKYSKHNAYSLLVYGYIRNIIYHDFDDNDAILIPFCLINLCALFYDELIANYMKLLQITSIIQNTFHNTKDIQYITLNDSKANESILTDTISFILDYVSIRDETAAELPQLLWNTIIFLQKQTHIIWFKYALSLCKTYTRLQQYEKSKHIIRYIDDHKCMKRIFNRQIVDASVISTYYSYKIENILIDIAINNRNKMNGTMKTELMAIYNVSTSVLDSFPHQYEFYEMVFYYFKMFLLFNDYENASLYLQKACKWFYCDEDMYKMYDIYTDQSLLEYNLLLYLLMNGTNDWDSTLFDSLLSTGRVLFRYEHRALYLTQEYLMLNIYDLCHQFPQYHEFVHCLFDNGGKPDISKLLSFDKDRKLVDQFLFEESIKIIINRRENQK